MTSLLPTGLVDLLATILWDLTIFGTLIGIAVALCLTLIGTSGISTRRLVAVSGLALMLVAPVIVIAPSYLGSRESTEAPLVTDETAARLTDESHVPAGLLDVGGSLRPVSEPTARHSLSAALVDLGLAVDIPRISGAALGTTARSIAVHLWLAGTLLALLRVAGALLSLKRLASNAAPADGGLQKLADELSQELKVTSRIEVRTGARVPVPMVLGWRRPFIALPVDIRDSLDGEQLRMVIAHELMHLRGRDQIVNVLLAIMRAPQFFHPIARWLHSVAATEREFICDDAAVRHAGGNSTSYAKALGTLALDATREPTPAFTGASVVARVKRLAGKARPWANGHLTWQSLGAVTASLVLSAAAVAVHGQSARTPVEGVTLPQALVALDPLGRFDPSVWITVVGLVDYSAEDGHFVTIAPGSWVLIEERTAATGVRSVRLTGATDGVTSEYVGVGTEQSGPGQQEWLESLLVRDLVSEVLADLLPTIAAGESAYHTSARVSPEGHVSRVQLPASPPADLATRRLADLESLGFARRLDQELSRPERISPPETAGLGPLTTTESQVVLRTIETLQLHSAGIYTMADAERLLDRLAEIVGEP